MKVGLIVLVLLGVVLVEGKGPELVGSSVWYSSNATLLNTNFDLAVVQMDFDQPLYTNGHSFLCPESDQECPSLSCKACDWSVQEATGCGDSTCCGPAQNGDMEKAAEWCSDEGPAYETLRIGETSRRITLLKGETMYVRFFVPEDMYCRSIVLVPRPYYGTLSWSFSTLEAYPQFSTVTGWRNGLAGDQKTFAYGQTGALFCPNTTLHPEYNVGTYSGMLYGLTETSFEIEIQVSPQKYPLPEPEVRFPCSDVPPEVLEYAGAHDPAVCVDDGASRTFTFADADPTTGQISMVLPVPKGCHTLSFSSASEIPTSPSVSHRLYCLPSQTSAPRDLGNACMLRIASNGQTMVLSTCFEEEVTYMICTLRIIEPEPVHFSFSSVAQTIRKNILEVPDASLSYMEGLQAAFGVTFGQPKYPCFDFYTNCFDFTVTPSDDTLFLFPPPASAQVDSDETYEDLQEFYRNAGLATRQENRLSMVVVFQAGTLSLTVKNTSSMSIAITSLSNKDGEPISLPGGGVDDNPASEKRYSVANYLPHIPLRDIPDIEFPPCDNERYTKYKDVVRDRLIAVTQSKTLDEVLSLKYSLDVMNEALLSQSCQFEISSKLEIVTEDVSLTDVVECRWPFGSLQYWGDPCCNIFLSLVSCCTPFDYNTTVTSYGTEADVSTCSEELCAVSYYEDLSFSLNNLEDVSLGCTSGIRNPSSALAVTIYNAIQDQYIVCLDSVGLGETYQGTNCQIDSDCEHLEGKCYEGKCVLAPLEELENAFLDCYINHMPSSLESYLKRNILPQFKGNKDSTEFYKALKEAATVKDCVSPSNPLAIQHRSRFQSQPLNKACVSTKLGLGWPNDVIDEVCPGETCLRSFGCLINVSSCVYEYCDGYTQNYIQSTEGSCPVDPTECDINVDDDCDGFHCVYCPPNGDPCQKVEGFSTQEECGAAFACELPGGGVDFTMTEEECQNQGTGCTTDCVGQSCGSVYEKAGGCFVPSITTNASCISYKNDHGVETEWFKGVLCVLSSTPEDACGLLPSTVWSTCQENALDSCDGSTITQQYLGCYVSKWRECRDQDECQASGQCTDRELYARISSYDPAQVNYGACISSGEYVAETKPFCGNDILVELTAVGCLFTAVNSQADCSSPNPFIFTSWVDVAETKEQCLTPSLGRRGCQLYRDPVDVLLWILDPEQCACQGGVLLDKWEWITGEWRGGVARSLEWKEAETESKFVFQDSLSFILFGEWIKDSSQEQFLYPLQSQIICESQSISRPLFILACDCTEDGGEDCYNALSLDKELQMGISEVCAGQEVFVKDPSAQVTFSKDSISSGCTFLDFKIIYQNYFSAPYVPPPLSFKWEEPKEQGVVINQKDTTVGEILGDGLVLSFSDPSSVTSFDVCLRLGQGEKMSYDVADFGYATEELEWIYPLGLDNIKVEERGSQGTWFCVPSLEYDDIPAQEGTVRLFPIARIKNYESKDDEYTDDTTRILCYILGACYCFVGVLCVCGLLLFMRHGLVTQKTLLSLPNFCTAAFLVLCIFRAVFMFLYPKGTFEFQPLSYFVIFEIPTFILFSVLIFMIYSFKRLVYKRGFFPGNPTPILAIGWTFVWGMWVVVTIVYSEVILEDDGGSSACEGRVEISYQDEEDATRTLSIAYQSVIVGVTFLLTSIFFYYTYLMYKSTKNKRSAFKQFIIFVGGSFNVSFFTRTVLLIIILAVDFASSIYLFCTLFITEIMMMSFLLFQFNIRYLRTFAERGSSSSSKASSRFGSRSTHNTHYELDD